MPDKIIVGVTGPAGAGKSHIAHQLCDDYGFLRLGFAYPLKQMLYAFLGEWGHDHATIMRMLEGDLKEHPSLALAGVSPRYALQTLGTEWGRERVATSIWAHHLTSRLRTRYHNRAVRIVIDDLRMPDEVDYLKTVLGNEYRVVVLKVSPATEARRHPGRHASELGLQDEQVDYRLTNDFTGSLRDGVAATMRDLKLNPEPHVEQVEWENG